MGEEEKVGERQIGDQSPGGDQAAKMGAGLGAEGGVLAGEIVEAGHAEGRSVEGCRPSRELGAETDATVGVGRTELDEGNTSGGDTRLFAATIDQPEHGCDVVGRAKHGFDPCLELGAIRIFSQFDFDDLTRLRNTDSDVHR